MPLESGSSGHVLVDVLDRVLDKGIVIDAAVRISLVGVELLGVDARVVVASIETYLRHADTIAYTDLSAAPRGGSSPPPAPLPAYPPMLDPAPEAAPPPTALYAEPQPELPSAPVPPTLPGDLPRTD